MRPSAAILCVLLCSCAADTSVHMAAKPSAEPKMLMPALENRIYELVDQERHKLDPAARPLALDSELVKAARQKSADMAAHHYLAHYAPDGQTAAGIIMEDDENFHGILGENLAAQPYLPKFGVDVETFARSLVNTWLASKGHRDNLADTAFGRTGIGAAANADTVYVTELFADDPASQKSQSSLQRNVSP